MLTYQYFKEKTIYYFPILVAVLLCGKYLLFQEYPSLAGGFYIAVGDQILNQFPKIATTVPHYTHDGVRLGMPPLAAIIVAALYQVADPTKVAFTLPLVYHICAVTAGTYLAKNYFSPDNFLQWLFVIMFGMTLAVSPSVTQWHITAGGTVRTLAYTFFLLVVSITIQLFRGGHQNRLLLLGIIVGFAASSHPFYGAMSCLTVFTGFLAFEPSRRGIKKVLITGLIAAVPVSTWLIPFTLNHGIDLYLGVSQTRGGLIHFTWSPLNRILQQGFRGSIRPFWIYFGVAGAITSIVRRRYFIVGLLIVSVYIIPRPRFIIIPLLLSSGMLITKDVPELAYYIGGLQIKKTDKTALFIVILLFLLALPTISMGFTHNPEPFVDDHAVDVADWVERETSPQATFIVADNFGEWFPLLAERTSLVAPRGAEWDPSGIRAQELRERNELYDCETAECIKQIAQSQPVRTNYVIVPQEMGVDSDKESTRMTDQLRDSEEFSCVYRNDGYSVFRSNPVESGKSPEGV
ncbi:hypothetical protein [Halorubrum ezzemoulense]|uniref:hypothetical protein n=1 Tax=Halorubrum ezzemoulense TaxID=337243 RepID=UPI0023314391|nr:hypothetical protein [Halorubrum ezzemoulense]MDB9253349.1 hypothetical protein [Halorubrum ezzemoulense]MDB9256286.1 hypothetical protein [Halorubrum ezzemoulense]MDB9277666.1 hypothetical protein [Halorubrum ezzemoulense]